MRSARRNFCLFLLVSLAFTLGFSEFVVIGILPQISDALSVSVPSVGLMIGGFAVSYAVITPLLTLSTGRFRRFSLLIAYCVVYSIANLLMFLALSYDVMIFSRLLLGAVSGGLLAVGITYIPELVARKWVSITISVVYSAFSVAMVFSTSLGLIIAEHFGWRAPLFINLLIGIIICAALVAFMPRSGKTDEPARVSEQLGLLGEKPVWLGMIVFVFGVGAVYTFYTFITLYLMLIVGCEPELVSAMLMAFGVMCLFSNLMSGWTDFKFGIPALRISFLVQALILLAIYVLQYVSVSKYVTLALIILLAFSMYILSVPIISLFMDAALKKHPKALTLASSLEPTAFNVGIAFGSICGSCVVGIAGLAYLPLVGALLSLMALLCVCLTLWSARKYSLLPERPERSSS